MLNTQKLLYILSDVSYVVELLPTKKEHTFAVQTFRQINGEFMDDNTFITNNVVKLLSKLEPDEYHLILPDFLFTNTIISVEAKSDTKIKEYLKSKLLPSLGISNDTHEIETLVLAEFKGNSKVQLSAIEKEILAPIRVAVAQQSAKVKAISPLSWTIKSLVSLEPSISVIQIGSKLYSAQHYIGIDQTNMADVGDTETIAETIKTLKGGEPNIQTVYLLTNQLVEDSLKSTLSSTIPLQQLASYKDEDSQMPSYVKEIIEAGMKTLSISDYPVPKFSLGKPSDEEKAAVVLAQTTAKEKNKPDDEAVEEVSAPQLLASETSHQEKLEAGDDIPPLPGPSTPQIGVVPIVLNTDSESVEHEEKTSITALKDGDDESSDIDTKNSTQSSEPLPSERALTKEQPMPTDSIDSISEKLPASSATPESINPEPSTAITADDESSLDNTLANFVPVKTTSETGSALAGESTIPNTTKSTVTTTGTVPTGKDNSGVIKNTSGVSTMLKMVFITLAVFFATVAVGVGVGLGLLQFSNKETNTGTPVASPIADASPEPTIEPSPSASPAAAIDPSKIKLLVVNATTKAGYAGTIKTALEKAKFTGVAAGNAKGEYEDTTNYLLVSEELAGLETIIEEATDLTFEVVSDADEKTVEDSKNTYDAVVVLSE